jgi:hypothetical protein
MMTENEKQQMEKIRSENLWRWYIKNRIMDNVQKVSNCIKWKNILIYSLMLSFALIFFLYRFQTAVYC